MLIQVYKIYWSRYEWKTNIWIFCIPYLIITKVCIHIHVLQTYVNTLSTLIIYVFVIVQPLPFLMNVIYMTLEGVFRSENSLAYWTIVLWNSFLMSIIEMALQVTFLLNDFATEQTMESTSSVVNLIFCIILKVQEGTYREQNKTGVINDLLSQSTVWQLVKFLFSFNSENTDPHSQWLWVGLAAQYNLYMVKIISDMHLF